MKDLSIKLAKEVEPFYDKNGAHDLAHVKRVLDIAEQIAKTEKGVDLDILRAGVLLHDIARKMEEEGKCENHAIKGAEMAPELLRNIGFPEDKIKAVQYCVLVHRKSKRIKAETIEAKILQDADRIEIFGAVGIARTFADLSARGMLLHSNKSRKLTYFEDTDSDSILEYMRSLLFATRKKFHTKKGWDIIKPRLEFIRNFIVQFEKEWRE